MGNSGFKTLAEAERFAASLGIRVTPSDREAIQKGQSAELKRLTALTQDQSQAVWVTAVFRRYTSLLEALVWIGNVLLTLSQTIIVSIGVPVVLVLLLMVEQQRAMHGILLFETDPGLAAFAASSLVLLNLVLEFQIHYIEEKAGYSYAQLHAPSLRVWLRNFRYFAGLGHAWEPHLLSPATRYKQLLRLVTFSILSLAVAGSMKSVIEQTQGPWHDALLSIVIQSDLARMFTWVAGLLFAATAVLSAQGLSRYVAIRCVEIMVSNTYAQNKESDRISQSLEEVGIQYILAKISAIQMKQREPDPDFKEKIIEAATSPLEMNHNHPI
jgi:hypothetical protein